jgi:hypothetical protein
MQAAAARRLWVQRRHEIADFVVRGPGGRASGFQHVLMRREACLQGHPKLGLIDQALSRDLASHSPGGLDAQAPLVQRRQEPIDLGPTASTVLFVAP